MDDPLRGEAQVQHIAVRVAGIEKSVVSIAGQVAGESGQLVHSHPVVPEQHFAFQGREVADCIELRGSVAILGAQNERNARIRIIDDAEPLEPVGDVAIFCEVCSRHYCPWLPA